MATQLPSFPAFQVQSGRGNETSNSAGLRWKKWLSKFDNMLCALDIDTDTRRKALLLHYVGEEAYDIYDSFTDTEKGIGATREETNSNGETVNVPDEYAKLCKSFTSYFTPKQNLSFEVYKFRQAKQEEGESIDSFYTRLRTLSSTCNFHDKDSEILSQIIQGCTSSRVRRRALRDNYTLEKLIEETRALELSENRATEMESSGARGFGSTTSTSRQQSSVNATRTQSGRGRSRTHSRGRGFGSHSWSRGKSQQTPQNQGVPSRCGNCGGNKSHQRCPAYGQECRNCKKMNHFAKCCRSKHYRQTDKHVNFAETSQSTEKLDDSSSDEYVFNLNKGDNHSETPSVHANVLNFDIKFLIDTGSSVNIISENVFNRLGYKQSLKQPVPLIFAYGSTVPLNVLGYFVAEIKYKDRSVKSELYVVRSTDSRHSRCLLGSKTAQLLNIVHFAFTSFASSSIPDQFPSLFDGKMGKIDGVKVKLHIDKDVTPVTQRHRRIPFHVRKEVEAEIKRLEDLDVIETVSGPTPWVSPVVIVPKKSKGVRVCIDMREANKAISREKHPMPTVEDLMSDLNSSTVFSKLDLSNAYHQLELDESSRYITTFTTHVGLRRYKRLLFGVNAASEIF